MIRKRLLRRKANKSSNQPTNQPTSQVVSIFLSNMNNSIYDKSFVRTDLSGIAIVSTLLNGFNYCNLTLIIPY